MKESDLRGNLPHRRGWVGQRYQAKTGEAEASPLVFPVQTYALIAMPSTAPNPSSIASASVGWA
jgi:hypothetical protein